MDTRLIDIAKLRKEMKEQDRRRQLDPDDDPTIPRVWVAYVWDEARGCWLIAGFSRTKRLKFPRITRIRRALHIEIDAVMKLLDLQHAARSGGPREAPHQYNPIVDRAWLAPSLRERA